MEARVETLARAAYGRLLAILAAKTGDIAAAEDALADAFAEALLRWPRDGAPEKPEAWLLTVARNRWRDRVKSAANRTAAPLEAAEDAALAAVDPDDVPDDRLALMFVAAHPAIDAGVRAPLMLQAVLGLDAARIGAAFLIPPAAMAQRLVRAKAKIKRARIPFEPPGRAELPARLEAVLEAIYGAYALDWTAPASPHGLTAEALFLADLTVSLLPDEPEALGLAALLAYSHARRAARRDRSLYVPLDEQDPGRWDRAAIVRGDALLAKAQAAGRIGRFQLEAAIQAAHCARRPGEAPNWPAIAALYEGLAKIAPTLGAAVGRAAAFGEAFGPEAGLDALGQIAEDDARSLQPYWAAKARLLLEAGSAEAAAAYAKAINLCTDPAARRWLEVEA
ncbi:MAG: DUF6596 domain-containing protein, partial [Pseudomonadota bacterium]